MVVHDPFSLKNSFLFVFLLFGLLKTYRLINSLWREVRHIYADTIRIVIICSHAPIAVLRFLYLLWLIWSGHRWLIKYFIFFNQSWLLLRCLPLRFLRTSVKLVGFVPHAEQRLIIQSSLWCYLINVYLFSSSSTWF